MQAPTQAPEVRRFGAFEIDLRSGELRKNGMRLRLSGQPFQILAALVDRPGEVVTREELNSKLWPADTFVDFDHGLNNAVARIREVLDDSSDTPRYVETIPRRGYRFIAPVSNGHSAAALPASQVAPSREVTSPSAVAPSVQPALGVGRSTRRWVLLGTLATLAIVALASYLYRRNSAGNQRPIKSIAVLPLRNLSGDPKQDYVAEGMTEDLIGRLSDIHELRVTSRTSVMRFKDTHLSVPEIARMLGADAIVEGSVIREGNRIRVHAQLIRAATDEHFWSESYDRELRDVLALQSEVAQSIAEKVKVTVTGKERDRLVAARPVSPEVYESYLKGLSTLNNTYSRAGLEESIGYFDEAIKRDAAFAPAYVGLAYAYDQLATVFIGMPPSEVRPRVISAARKALELDPDLAQAHVLLGDVYQAQWRWSEAEAEYNRALELKPNDASAHVGFSHWLLCEGRTEEAITWVKRGRELDPTESSGSNVGQTLFYSHRYEESIRELRSVVAVRPNSAAALWYLGFSLIANGQPEEAIPVLEKAVSVSDRSPGVIGVLIRAYAHAGRRNDALGLLDELKRRREKGYVPAGAFVNAYLGLDDREQVFIWLEHAFQEQSNILQFVKIHPYFDPVRTDPRFVNLIRRVGLN